MFCLAVGARRLVDRRPREDKAAARAGSRAPQKNIGIAYGLRGKGRAYHRGERIAASLAAARSRTAAAGLAEPTNRSVSKPKRRPGPCARPASARGRALRRHREATARPCAHWTASSAHDGLVARLDYRAVRSPTCRCGLDQQLRWIARHVYVAGRRASNEAERHRQYPGVTDWVAASRRPATGLLGVHVARRCGKTLTNLALEWPPINPRQQHRAGSDTRAARHEHAENQAVVNAPRWTWGPPRRYRGKRPRAIESTSHGETVRVTAGDPALLISQEGRSIEIEMRFEIDEQFSFLIARLNRPFTQTAAALLQSADISARSRASRSGRASP